MRTTFCPVHTPKGKAPSRLSSTDDVYAPFLKSLCPLQGEMIERPWVLLRLLRLKPPPLEHGFQELHPCHASEVVVARAGLTHRRVVSDLALCLGTPRWCGACA